MIELQPSQLASEVSALLLSSGAEIPSLQWHLRPKQFTKSTLDTIDDAKLFDRETLADEGMVAAVRALLYVWNGWPHEASMFAQAAPDPERTYVAGFCERQLGHADRAKACFREIDNHPIYTPLAAHAVEAIDKAAEPLLRRFKELLEFGETWEPFLFIDLVEQACAGKLAEDSNTAIRKLQCYEFELLLRHCYERAIGEPLPEVDSEESKAEQEERIRQVRRLRDLHRPARIPRPERRQNERKPPGDEKTAGSATPPAPATQATVKIACPKCGAVTSFPESSRGRSGNCGKCGAAFLIPKKDAGAAGASSKAVAATVVVRCPKCGEMVRRPESARGAKETCAKCGTAFLIPKR